MSKDRKQYRKDYYKNNREEILQKQHDYYVKTKQSKRRQYLDLTDVVVGTPTSEERQTKKQRTNEDSGVFGKPTNNQKFHWHYNFPEQNPLGRNMPYFPYINVFCFPYNQNIMQPGYGNAIPTKEISFVEQIKCGNLAANTRSNGFVAPS